MDNNYTHISIVLDRSGSMQSIADDTIGGFNKFLQDQKKVSGKATVSLIQFDDVYEEVYIGKDLQEAKELTKETFVPRNQTALLDAIGKTINKTGEWLKNIPEAIRPGKVIFVIMTDGQENASKEFTRTQIFDMIKHQTDSYKWAFVFLGANQDAIQAGASMGIGKGSSWTYSATSDGTKKAFFSMSSGVSSMRSSNLNAADYATKVGYFQDADREKV